MTTDGELEKLAQSLCSRRDFLKASAALTGAAMTLPAWLAACGPGQQPVSGTEKVVRGGHITDSIHSAMVGFNPVLVAEGPVQSTPQSLLFTGLLVETPTGDLLPRLAHSMPQVSPDGKT